MRGNTMQQVEVLIALTPDGLVPQDHPIRRIRPIVKRVLKELSPVFSGMYADIGRPSHPTGAPLEGQSPHCPVLRPFGKAVLRTPGV